MWRVGIAIVIVWFACAPSARAQTSAAKRRVFVLHSGMHIILAPADKNLMVKTMKQILSERGIALRDIVALNCPFPTASVTDMFPRAGLLIYLESTDPAARSSQEAYARVDKALQAHGVSSSDDIVWIGHSAGGQMGMTLAHLAHNLDKFPALAKKAHPYHFEMVITLGSAVGANPVPDSVKLRHYYSPGDMVIKLLSKHGDLVADSMGFKVRFRPCCDVRENSKIRVFKDVEHPCWYFEPRVLECIFREFEANSCPAWRRTHADLDVGMGLSQLIAQAVESRWHISLEEVGH